jgi:putative exosortase-associated protein (TIGR04073 family)
MRNTVPLLATIFVTGLLAAGCANTEKKFGRGMGNVFEIVRAGELRRSMEQTALFDGPDVGYTTGFMRGLNRSLARTGVGLYEIVTAPFPPYDPVFTDYLAPGPVYPDNFTPGLMEDSIWATDSNLGFAGGDVAPVIPGSRFRIFDNH